MADTRPLSERLAEIADLPAIAINLTLARRTAIAEAAALARRVEAAPVGDLSASGISGKDWFYGYIDGDGCQALIGKRVALVEVGEHG